ncbi:MAG TPA: hypothetical protein VMZ52_00890 [Bryobacteraceae bacterium]|nr:hypothetical protein [Bryobacteraceae bacterium]
MDMIGDRRFVEIPGEKLHELPPLLVRTASSVNRLDKVVGMANDIIESEDLISESPNAELLSDLDHERRRMDLAINLVEQYLGFVHQWQWGDGILEWIRQCEMTFDVNLDLRNVLRADLWPHASRCSFVTLLEDKGIKGDGIDLEKAVGLRLTFRQPPPMSCFSNQFLFYLNSTVATTAYQTWSHMNPAPISCLPPERFSFQVYNM